MVEHEYMPLVVILIFSTSDNHTKKYLIEKAMRNALLCNFLYSKYLKIAKMICHIDS